MLQKKSMPDKLYTGSFLMLGYFLVIQAFSRIGEIFAFFLE
ncbi:hypothetical protein CHCC20372_0951 [Bacillus paralicheniformis]|nr:hypothetical protein CHCC20372_0951 [Bacillus paralicheniformis]